MSQWRKFPDVKPDNGQLCIVAGGPDRVSQIIALRWDAYEEEFIWHSDSDGLGIDPFPTEIATHWMPWPDDPGDASEAEERECAVCKHADYCSPTNHQCQFERAPK